MTKTKIINSFLLSALFFVVSVFFANTSLAAARLYFDPENANAAKGENLQVFLKIDVENQSAFGADATLTFPSNDFTIKSVDNGGFFTDFSYALSEGKIEIHGYFSALYNSKSGSGNFAVITLNSDKDSGSGNLTFTCSSGSTDTEIINSNGQNILSCSSLNQMHLAYTSTTNGPTNACGGTCGSNYNCDNGLFCFEGFCRNPDCRTDISCGCKITPTPKATLKATIKPAITNPTPQIVSLSRFTTPTPRSAPSELPVEASPSGQSFDYVRVGIWTALSLLALLLIIGILRLFRKDDDEPPTSSVITEEPFNQPETTQTSTEPIQTANSNPPVQEVSPWAPPQNSETPQNPTV